eukprot:CAMPEP_0115000788 /NCGR_PEP_ID=MMETSP0216-20121206/16969_1 /TAXON_ID=223996 /ORGANISM="Protocruzia adherens, Strain Boccale" /LENGTH=188 /DNA_ID=CAMNT_0002365959 /DNA_START=348 /DNA_END=914 /DNA_ORIENTATION=-
MKKHKNVAGKFPLVRIKKIMQSDEEIGKVANTTPVLISKALELFIKDLVNRSCQVAIDNNHAKVEESHLKASIKSQDRFSFLSSLCESFPDLPDAPNFGAATSGDASPISPAMSNFTGRKSGTRGGKTRGTRSESKRSSLKRVDSEESYSYEDVTGQNVKRHKSENVFGYNTFTNDVQEDGVYHDEEA